MSTGFKFFIPAVLVAIAIFYLSMRFPEVLNQEENRIHLVSLTAVLAYLILAFSSHRLSTNQTLKYITAWSGIALILILGYNYRTDLQEILFPFTVHEKKDGSVSIGINENGHFVLEAEVEGQQVRFLVDTGASKVVLTQADAARLGFNVDNLNYNQRSSTANGTTWNAAVRIKTITVGPIVRHNVRASVSRGGLNQSLLGMTFLETLSGYQVTKDKLILWN